VPFFQGACSVLSLAGNASNFALYCLAGSRFRRALCDAARRCTRSIAAWCSTLMSSSDAAHRAAVGLRVTFVASSMRRMGVGVTPWGSLCDAFMTLWVCINGWWRYRTRLSLRHCLILCDSCNSMWRTGFVWYFGGSVLRFFVGEGSVLNFLTLWVTVCLHGVVPMALSDSCNFIWRYTGLYDVSGFCVTRCVTTDDHVLLWGSM